MSGSGSLGFGSSKGSEKSSSKSSDLLNQMAVNFADETAGLRGQIIYELSNALGLGYGGNVETKLLTKKKNPDSDPTPNEVVPDEDRYIPAPYKQLLSIFGKFEPVEYQTIPASSSGESSGESSGSAGNQVVNRLIQSAVESSMRAGSQARKQIEEENARTGLSGTPFGVSQLANVMRESNYATSQIAPQMKNQVYQKALDIASNFVLGQGQVASSSLTGAIPGNTSTRAKGDSVGLSLSGGGGIGGSKG